MFWYILTPVHLRDTNTGQSTCQVPEVGKDSIRIAFVIFASNVKLVFNYKENNFAREDILAAVDKADHLVRTHIDVYYSVNAVHAACLLFFSLCIPVPLCRRRKHSKY